MCWREIQVRIHLLSASVYFLNVEKEADSVLLRDSPRSRGVSCRTHAYTNTAKRNLSQAYLCGDSFAGSPSAEWPRRRAVSTARRSISASRLQTLCLFQALNLRLTQYRLPIAMACGTVGTEAWQWIENRTDCMNHKDRSACRRVRWR